MHFSLAKLQVLEIESSDHLSIFLALGVQLQRFVQKMFQFENSWIQEVDCKLVVENGWQRSLHMQLQERIEYCVKQLQLWSKNFHAEFRK